jgi:hypothetical protein
MDEFSLLEQFRKFARVSGLDGAIMKHDAKEMRRIFEDYHIDSLGYGVVRLWGLEALRTASLLGHAEIISVLFEYGVEVIHEDESRVSPLRMACAGETWMSKNPDFPGTVKLLIAHGANLQEKNELGRGLLHYVAMYAAPSSIEVASILMEHGIQINTLSYYNETPIFFACSPHAREHGTASKIQSQFENRANLVEYFIRQGADISIRSRGLTCLQNALSEGENPNKELINVLNEVGKRKTVIQLFAKHSMLHRLEVECINEMFRHSRK